MESLSSVYVEECGGEANTACYCNVFAVSWEIVDSGSPWIAVDVKRFRPHWRMIEHRAQSILGCTGDVSAAA